MAAALDGARAILVERFGEDADLLGSLREHMWSNGATGLDGAQGQEDRGREVQGLFRLQPSPCTKLPSHRVLALFRGEKEEILELQILPEPKRAGGRCARARTS